MSLPGITTKVSEVFWALKADLPASWHIDFDFDQHF